MKKIRQHYHWIVVSVGCLEMLIFGGLLNCFSVFIIPICEEFGVARSSYALADMPYYIVCTVSTMLSGFLFQRFGYKRVSTIGLCLQSSLFC